MMFIPLCCQALARRCGVSARVKIHVFVRAFAVKHLTRYGDGFAAVTGFDPVCAPGYAARQCAFCYADQVQFTSKCVGSHDISLYVESLYPTNYDIFNKCVKLFLSQFVEFIPLTYAHFDYKENFMSLQIAIKKTAPQVRRDELKFIQRLVAGWDGHRSAAYAGATKGREGYFAGKWIRDERIQERLQYELRAVALTKDLTRARVVILKLMEDDAIAPAVRLAAAKTVQEYAKQFMIEDKARDPDDKSITEMSIKELNAHIAKLEAASNSSKVIEGKAVLIEETAHSAAVSEAAAPNLLNMLE